MRLFTSFLATVAMLAMAPAAFAGVIYTASATTSDGSPLTAVTQNAQIIIDITVRTDDNAFSVAGSVNNYDNTIVGLNAGTSTIAASVFNQFCFPASGCFNGLANQVGDTITFQENAVGPGVEAEFLAALGLSAAGGNGSIDEGLGGVGGAPQFQIVYDVNENATEGQSTTFNIGTFSEYLDGYTGTVDQVANNTSLTITVPEPAAIQGSLAALASVFGVVAVRRRML